ncbi:MAG: hypothetical protein WD793_14010 [Steroidobacteraceae bacterium]
MTSIAPLILIAASAAAPGSSAGTDGTSRIGFAGNAAGRIIALSGGSWKVLERID